EGDDDRLPGPLGPSYSVSRVSIGWWERAAWWGRGSALLRRRDTQASSGEWRQSSLIASARPKGLPSESRQTAHRSPGCTTTPPKTVTRSIAAGISSTVK